MRAATGNMKRTSMEFGGTSPDLVCADAALEATVPGAAMAVFQNSGQICRAGTRLFMQRRVYEEYVQRVAARAKALKVGNPLDPQTQPGPVVSAEPLDRVAGYPALGREQGARAVTGAPAWHRRAMLDFDSPKVCALRADLALALRAAAHHGLAEGVRNHFSAELPDGSGRFLLNPRGLLWAEAQAEDIVLVDAAGKRLVCGERIAWAYDDLYDLERACLVQVLAQSTGRPLVPVGPALAHRVGEHTRGERVWSALFFEALRRRL